MRTRIILKSIGTPEVINIIGKYVTRITSSTENCYRRNRLAEVKEANERHLTVGSELDHHYNVYSRKIRTTDEVVFVCPPPCRRYPILKYINDHQPRVPKTCQIWTLHLKCQTRHLKVHAEP